MKPFLRWVGGKALFVESIIKHFPECNKIKTYYEPFIGAGSLFLSYNPKKSIISDLNPQLINVYLSVRNNYSLLYKYLREYSSKNTEAFYYKLRNEYNESTTYSIKQAARFIYLNKACFNGIFRVNLHGEFNVPFGRKKNLAFPTKNELEKISNLLKHSKILCKDFSFVTNTASENDFVYLDPPYPPLNGSSFFTHYTKERFSSNDQCKVAKLANHLDSIGCKVLITNADTYEIRNLYSNWSIEEIQRTRWVTSSKTKHKVGELIIKNYSK